jgi:DNA-binding response OmpR family regulator
MKLTVWVVEDEAPVRQLLVIALENHGYNVLAFADGLEVVNHAAQSRGKPPDLIVMDVMMPNMDGYEAIRALRSNKRIKDVPIIILSAASEPDDVLTGMEIGADDYQTKPFNIAVFLARVKKRIALHHKYNPYLDLEITTPKTTGLCVGVNRYRDKSISNLNTCENDARLLYNILFQSDTEGRSALLSTEKKSPSATSPTTNTIIGNLVKMSQSADPQDTLMFYFSGHGSYFEGQSYLFPADTYSYAIEHTAIPVHKIKEIMSKSVAQSKIMILDSCHSGASIGKTDSIMSPEFIRDVFSHAEGFAIIASCKQGEKSYEWLDSGYSAFSYFLIEGLQGKADNDHKGFVTVNDIARYVTHGVKEWARGRGLVQSPTVQIESVGDVVIHTYP